MLLLKRSALLLTALLLQVALWSQITLSPEKPGLSEEVLLTFNASEGDAGLKGYMGDVYMHTGLITAQSSHGGDWKHVVADWGQNDERLRLTRVGPDRYQTRFRITDLYGVETNEEIYSLAFVFRSADGLRTGKAVGGTDIFYPLREVAFRRTTGGGPRDTCRAPEPDWSRNAVIYEVNVRQFTPQGTFSAFAQHLPRLRQMGVDILWFMPIQPIGIERRKGGLGSYYSIRNYTATNPEFGSLADFKRVVDTAHALGFKVILDWVANHTAHDHHWVKEHPDWYVYDAKGVIVSPFDWTDVAKLNYNALAMRRAMIEAMRFWIRDVGLDGFRCDVAGEVPADFWEEARLALEAVKPVWMLAEDASQMRLLQKAFNANYGWPFHHLMNEIAQGKKPASAIFDLQRETDTSYPYGSYPMHFITNHDENSWNGTEYERLGDGVRAFSVLYYTMPGMPLIYSGQEAALDKRLRFFDKDTILWGDYPLADFYRRLNALKHEQRALWNGRHGGAWREIKHEHPRSIAAFVRTAEDSKIIVVLNLSADTQQVRLQIGQDAGIYREYFTGHQATLLARIPLLLEPWAYKVYLYERPAERPRRSFRSMEQQRTGLRIRANDGTLHIGFFSPHAVEVAFEPDGQTNPPSYGTAGAPSWTDFSVKELPQHVEVSTSGLRLYIHKDPLRIEYRYRGQPLTGESEGYRDDGEYQGFAFTLSSDEILLGGGERVLGMNRRGHRLRLYNKPSYGYETHAPLMYYSLPVAISSRKYLIAFDNGADGYLDLGASEPDALRFEAVGGRMSYFVVAASTWPELATHYTAVTGRQPLPPRWTLGNIASRMGYRSQREVEEVVRKYRQDSIPLDAIVLDLFWFGPTLKGHLGNLDWYRDSFPQPDQMMADLKRQGVKTVLITEPFILRGTRTFEEVIRRELVGKTIMGKPYLYDFYFGHTALLDLFKPETRLWFWDIYRKHTISGVDGWWGDLGEPEVHPDDLQHVIGPARTVHNLYGHVWAQMIYEGYRRDFPQHRPVILMRSGFIGSQRYGIIPWSGDVNRTWEGLKPQVEIALSMGLQGLGYMHSDLGGFAGSYRDPELYIRWLQYGVFQPIYRTHAQESVPAEPIFWDDTTKNIVRRYIRLRYALLPYHYTLAWENHTTGLPLMRPLCYADDDPALLTNTTSYLWGNAFLVSPVVEKGATTQTVHFPRGSVWIDFWTGKAHTGGQAVRIPVGLEHIPVFVRAGAFVPMSDKLLPHTDAYDPEVIAVHYYHHPTATAGAGTLYEDDGYNPDAIAQKAYTLLRFTAAYQNNRLTLKHRNDGFYPPARQKNRPLKYVVHGVERAPRAVRRIARGGKTPPLAHTLKEGGLLEFYLNEETDEGAVVEF